VADPADLKRWLCLRTGIVVAEQRVAATLAPFAFVGRMALTNYILQSIVCTLFFYTMGFYGRMGPALDLIPSVVLYSAQVTLCIRWLKRFRFGPLEWAWRGMTYGRLPALRKEPATATELVTQEV